MFILFEYSNIQTYPPIFVSPLLVPMADQARAAPKIDTTIVVGENAILFPSRPGVNSGDRHVLDAGARIAATGMRLARQSCLFIRFLTDFIVRLVAFDQEGAASIAAAASAGDVYLRAAGLIVTHARTAAPGATATGLSLAQRYMNDHPLLNSSTIPFVHHAASAIETTVTDTACSLARGDLDAGACPAGILRLRAPGSAALFDVDIKEATVRATWDLVASILHSKSLPACQRHLRERCPALLNGLVRSWVRAAQGACVASSCTQRAAGERRCE